MVCLVKIEILILKVFFYFKELSLLKLVVNCLIWIMVILDVFVFVVYWINDLD